MAAEIVRNEKVDGVGFDLPITLEKEGETYIVSIDGVEWVRTDNQMHATVMFHMMRENIADYVTYMPRR